MKRTLYKAFLVIICSIMFTGCWDRRELNELSIVAAIGLDFVDGEHVVTVQIMNPGEISPAQKRGGGGQMPVVTFQEKGTTILAAMRRLTKIVPREVYLAYIRIVVIGDALAKQGIVDSLDFLLREHEFRTDFYLMVAKDSQADEILRVLTPLVGIPAEKVFDSLEISERVWAATGKIEIDGLLADIITGGQEPILTGIEVVGNKNIAGTSENVGNIEKPAFLKLTDMAAFKGDKMVGWLNEFESKGYHYTQGNVHSTVVDIPCSEKGTIGIVIRHTDVTLRTDITNGQPRGRITVDAEADIGDVECTVDLTERQTFTSLEQRLEKRIHKSIADALHKAQKELQADIFGFGRALYRSEPQAWMRLKQDWEQTFSGLPVDITVKAKLRDKGAMSKSIREIMKEGR